MDRGVDLLGRGEIGQGRAPEHLRGSRARAYIRQGPAEAPALRLPAM
jgi:hypothetical protein